MRLIILKTAAVVVMAGMSVSSFAAENVQQVEANRVAEVTLDSAKTYKNPFF